MPARRTDSLRLSAPSSPAAPVLPLRGARVLLRPFTAADGLDAAAGRGMHAVYGDAEVMRFVGDGRPTTPAQSAAMITDYRRHQEEHGFAFWAVLDAADGRLVGDAGLEVTEHGVELGYTLARSHWGRGIGTEAARLCVDAAFGPLALPRLVALADAGNDASAHVLAKLGFRAGDGAVPAYGRPHRRFVLERPARA
ncbi:GNAT family N-acetyltransferase [Brachybacterium sp. DNPG3]